MAAHAPIVLFHHATIYPGVGLRQGDAMAIQEGNIIAVGSLDEIKKNLAPDRYVDLAGAYVFPGFQDAHLHLMGLGQRLLWVDLVGCTSKAEVIARIQNRTIPDHQGWIQGFGWDQNLWNNPMFPTAADLDVAFPDLRLWLMRIDGHVGWTNSAAMQAAQLTPNMDDPIGGKMMRDIHGKPTGIFLDQARLVITRNIPPMEESEFDLALQLAIQECLQHGITAVHDAGVDWQTIKRYQRFLDNGKLPLRIFAMYDGTQEPPEQYDFSRLPIAKEYLQVRTVKLFCDGALGSRGAALLENYSDDPRNSGFLSIPAEKLKVYIEKITQAGLQTSCHAIGDRTNRILLDIYETVMTAEQRKKLRPRIEHAQVLSLQDIPRFSQLGVIASIQPTHVMSDMKWVAMRLGEERLQGAYAWQKLAQSGARLAGGTDAPIESVDPRRSFYAAITRQDEQGNPPNGWYPDQCLTREQAWKLLTSDVAYSGFAEDYIGTLEPGKAADFIVTDRNLMTCPAKKLLNMRIWQTYVAGELVYAHPQFQTPSSSSLASLVSPVPSINNVQSAVQQENIVKHPYPKSWWVKPGQLLAGCFPGDLDPQKAETKLKALLDAGMRTFICLQEEHETNGAGMGFDPYLPRLQELAKQKGVTVEWHRFPIQDDHIPTPDLMKSILKTISQSLAKNNPVYVHCWGGHGRTGTVIGCWLVEQGLKPEEALAEIIQLRFHDPHLQAFSSPQNAMQENFVKNWPELRRI